MKTLITLFLATFSSAAFAQNAGSIPVEKPLRQQLTFFDPADMYPADASGAYFDWASCLQPATSRSPVRTDGRGNLLPLCQPDTLYSWQEDSAVKWLEQSSTPAAWARPLSHPLYTHINPVATYGYGGTPLRLKLRPGTKFVVVQAVSGKEPAYCKELPAAADVGSTVVVRVFAGGTDYILCSLNPVESWSKFQPKAFDEIVASTLWYLDQSPRYDWLPYHEMIPAVPGDTGHANLFISEDEQRDFDGHSFMQSDLLDRLVGFRAAIQAKDGRLFYAPGVAAEEERHFATERPIYWNTRKPGLGAQPAAVPAPPAFPPVVNGNYQYDNPKAAFRVAYPAALFWPGDHDNAESLSALGKDDSFRLSAFANAASGSLADAYKDAQQSGFFPVTYKSINVKAGFFVLSGESDGMIFYQKVFMLNGKQAELTLQYASSAKAALNPVAAAIAASFQPKAP